MKAALVVYRAVPDGSLFLRRGLLAELERSLRRLEREYERDVDRIRRFEKRFRPAVGERYDELERLREQASRGWEALGRASESGDPPDSGEVPESPGQSAPKPGGEARRLFLALARQIHPDLAADESERGRRHEVMAEATLAYRDSDHRRLQWLLEHWQAESEPIEGFDPGSQWTKINRQIAWVRYRLREMQYSIGQLHASPVASIMREHEAARADGRNLILELRRQVSADLDDARRELERLGNAIADLPGELRAAVASECGLCA